MRKRQKDLSINLFPFLTILLASMGVLAFIGLSLLFSYPEQNEYQNPRDAGKQKNSDSDTVLIEFQLIGKPETLYPHYVICKKDEIYLKDNKISIPWNEEYHYFLFYNYLKSLEARNQEQHNQFKDHQEYIIFTVYPSGIQTYYDARRILQTYTKLNFGVEPMLPNWKIAGN